MPRYRGARTLFILASMEELTRLRKVAIADDSPAFLAAAANYVASLPGFVLAGIASTAPQTLAIVEAAKRRLLVNRTINSSFFSFQTMMRRKGKGQSCWPWRLDKLIKSS